MAKLIKGLMVIFLGVVMILAAACANPFAPPDNTGSPEDPSHPENPAPPEDPDQPENPDPSEDELTFEPHESAAGVPDRLTTDDERIVDFSQTLPSEFYWADGYSNGGMFNCTWRKSSAVVRNGIMNMSVSEEGKGYAGAEYRSRQNYSYGFYSVCMKAANCSGVISSFFTYTNQPVWDEIDIEFLGKDMTRVQFNYYTNGVGGHEFYFDLGFDASEDFHEYAFDWQRDSITWYIDGKAVYRATKNLPSHAMQIMANVWNCVGIDDWSGAFDVSALPATAQYRWIAYSPN